MSDRMAWKIKRIQQNIKQITVASFLNCSSTLLSLYENDKSDMSADKVTRYKNYIQGNN
jgi:transcriptional regulator with XRE-family HTH domain